MEQIFQIDPKLDVPIYQQLVDTVRAAVQKGLLTAGQKLPTVQEMAQLLSVARGTVKRAYDELEHKGLLEKVQGRGTFIRYQPANSGSRKEQAMAAIDAMLNQLENMGLSPAEINIFLNLKLRQRAEQESQLKVAVLECNPETLSSLAEQLRAIPRLDLYTHLAENVAQYPYKLGEDMDLIVTTAKHAAFLENVLPERKKIIKVALRLEPQCLCRIIKLPKDARLGILSYSEQFGALLEYTCQMYAPDTIPAKPVLFSAQPELDVYLQDKDAVLVPYAYEKYCSAQGAECLRRFPGELIRCSFEMDEGSFLYLKDKVKRMLDEKTI